MQQVLILGLLVAQVLCVQYELTVVTGAGEYDGTDGTIEAKLIGSKGTLNLGVLDNWGNDFQVGAIDSYTGPEDSPDLGKIECVEITAKSGDAWMVDYMIVDDGSAQTYLYNSQGTYLSTDVGEGADKMRFCKQGDSTYTLEITTATDDWADTDKIHARVTVSSAGNKGSATSGILDNKDINDFERGAVDTFILHDLKNVGNVGCIKVTVEEDDAWLFDTITVKRGKMERTFRNTDKVWLSSDLTEGSNTDTLELCN